MIDSAPGDGPSDGTLRRLAGMMGSMKKGLLKGKIGGRGIPVRRPMTVCKICAKRFEASAPKGDMPPVAFCQSCQAMLSEGYSALISPERFAFIKSTRFTPGEVVPISEAIMERVANSNKKSDPTKN